MVAHVDLDSFFVAVERARRPDLAGRPVIIGGRPGSRGMVAAASREARRCGIRVGMPLAAASLRCPDGVFLDGAFDAYFSASLQVDEILRRESPDIEWRSIDEAFVGLASGARPRAASELAAVERIQQGVRTLGFDVACGLARSKLVAQIASRLGRPRGVVHVLDGYEALPLPLKIKGCSPGIDPALARRLRAAASAGWGRSREALRGPSCRSCATGARAGDARRRPGGRCRWEPHPRTAALPPARIEEHPLAAPGAGSRSHLRGARRATESSGGSAATCDHAACSRAADPPCFDFRTGAPTRERHR